MADERDARADVKCLLVMTALADSASVTGQTVVAKVTVSVTTITSGVVEAPSTAEVARAGQLVMEAAHEVMVRTVVAKTVKVVWPASVAVAEMVPLLIRFGW